MESSGILSAAKKGLMSKLERFTGIYGGIFGWRSLKRKRLEKRLEKKEARREKRFARLAREFKGRLMLEPLEERIVPAVVPAQVLVGAQEFVLLNFSSMGGDGETYGIVANAGPDPFVVNLNAEYDGTTFLDPGVDELRSISLWSNDNGAAETFDTTILTNIRVPLLDDAFVDSDDGGTGDTVNATLVTGLEFGSTGGDQVTFGSMTFSLAADFDPAGAVWEGGNFTLIVDSGSSSDPAFLLDQFDETNAHASDVGVVDANNNGRVNFVEQSTIAGLSPSAYYTAAGMDYPYAYNVWAGIDTRVADKDGGDVGVGYDHGTVTPVAGDVHVSGTLGADGADADNWGFGIWARDGSILASSTGLNFQGPPLLLDADITAENIGVLKAGLDIGDPAASFQSIIAGDGADTYYNATINPPHPDYIPDGVVEQIRGVWAGRAIDVDEIAADDGIYQIIAGLGGDDGDVSTQLIDGNADRMTTPEDIGIDLIRAINGDVSLQEVTTDDNGQNDDWQVDNAAVGVVPDPNGYDLPQNRPTDIRRIEAIAPETGERIVIIESTGGVGTIRSDADLGPVVSGFQSDPFENPFGSSAAPHTSGYVNVDQIVVEGTSDVIIGPGGVFTNLQVWRAATFYVNTTLDATTPDVLVAVDNWADNSVTTPYLLNVWSGRDMTRPFQDFEAGVGVVYRVEALQPDGSAADDVTAAVFFNSSGSDPLGVWINPELAILDLNTAAGVDPADTNWDPATDLFDDDTVVNSQTDFRVTTSEVLTETLPASVTDDDTFIAFARTVPSYDGSNPDSLADHRDLVDMLGIDVDGAAPYAIDPGTGRPLQGPAVDGMGETDLRNVVLEANLGIPDKNGPAIDDGVVGIIDLDYDLPNPNETDNVGDVAYLGIVGEIVQPLVVDSVWSIIDVESVLAVGTSAGNAAMDNLVNLTNALNVSSVTSVKVTEVQDVDIIAQRELRGTSFDWDFYNAAGSTNPGFVLYYNDDTGIFPRAFNTASGLGDDYNNILYVGAPPVADVAIPTVDVGLEMIHVNIDYIDGNTDGAIQVHELANDIDLPDYPANTPAGYDYEIGTIMGHSPILSLENDGGASVALITTDGGSPDGGEIGFIEWEGNVGGVVTVDPDPVTDLTQGDELDAYLGSLTVGLPVNIPFNDDDAFTVSWWWGGVAATSDLGYVDVEGDIGFVRMHHLTPYNPFNPHAGFGHIPISVIMGEPLPNVPLVTAAFGNFPNPNFNLQGIFVTGDLLGTLTDGDVSNIGVQTTDTVSDSIASHGEELLADFIWDSEIGVRTADLSSVIAGNDIQGHILVDGKIWDNVFAGYYGTGSMGIPSASPILITAENTDPDNPAPDLAKASFLWWHQGFGGPYYIAGNGTGDIGGDLADYTFDPHSNTAGVLMFDPLAAWWSGNFQGLGWWYGYINPAGSEGDDTATYLNAFERMVNKDWHSEVFWWSWWSGFGLHWWFWSPPVPGLEGPVLDPVPFAYENHLQLEDYVGAAERVEAELFADRDISANMIAGEKWISTGGSIEANRDINGHILTGSDLIADVHADADGDTIGDLNGSIIAGLVSQSSLDYTFNFLPDSTGVDLDPTNLQAFFYGPGVTDTMYNPLAGSTQIETEENDTLVTADPIMNLTYTDPNDPRAVAISGVIDNPADSDYYRFHAQIGDTLVVTIIADRVGTFGTGFDPLLTLYAPDGQPIVYSDLSCAGFDGVMEITLPVTGDAAVQGDWTIEVQSLWWWGGGEYTLDVMLLPPSNLLTGNILGEGDSGTISAANINSEIIQAGSRASLFGMPDLVPVGSFPASLIAFYSGLLWWTGWDSWMNFEGSVGSIGQPIEAYGQEGSFLWWGDEPHTFILGGDIAVHDIRAIGGDIVGVNADADIYGWDGVEGWWGYLGWWNGPHWGWIDGRGPGDWVPQYAEIDAIKYGGLFLNEYTTVLGTTIPPLTEGESTGGTIFEITAGRDIGGVGAFAFGFWGWTPLTIHASDDLYLLKAGDDMFDVHVVTDIMPWPSIGTWWGPFGAWWGGALGANLPDDEGGIGLVIAGDDMYWCSFVAGGSFAVDTAIPGTYTFELPNDDPDSIAGIAIDNTYTIDQADLDDPTVPAGFAVGQIIARGAGDGKELWWFDERLEPSSWWSPWWWSVDMYEVAVLTKGDVGLIETTVGDMGSLWVDAGSNIWHVSAGGDLWWFDLSASDHVVLVEAGDDMMWGWINSDNAVPFLYSFSWWWGQPDPDMLGVGGVGAVIAQDGMWWLEIDADGQFDADFDMLAEMGAFGDLLNTPTPEDLLGFAGPIVLPADTSVGLVVARGLESTLGPGDQDDNGSLSGADERDIAYLTVWADGDILLVWSVTGDIENSFIQSDANIYAVQAGPQEAGADLLTTEMHETIWGTDIQADDNVYFVRAFDDIEEDTDIIAGYEEWIWWMGGPPLWWMPNGTGAVGMVIAGDAIINGSDVYAYGNFGVETDFAAAMPAVVTALLSPTDAYAPMVFEDRRGVIRTLEPFSTDAPVFTADIGIGWVIALGQEAPDPEPGGGNDADGIHDAEIMTLNGDIVLVDAVFGEITDTSITSQGSSIYRIHVGGDFEPDLDVEADDHIIEIEVEGELENDDIRSDQDADSVGGIGSLIAGEGIDVDDIEADGTFVPGTFPTEAEALAMFPTYTVGPDIGYGAGVTGEADITSTFASSGHVESRAAVVVQNPENGSVTTSVTFVPYALDLDSFATDQVVVDVFGPEWATIGYSIGAIISTGIMDIWEEGLDDPEYEGIDVSHIYANGPIDAISADTGDLDVDGRIDSDTGNDEVPQAGINFVYSHNDLEGFEIRVEKGHLGVVASAEDIWDMEIDVEREGDPMPFVGGNVAIVWAGDDMFDVDIWADGAITGDVSAGADMTNVDINADLYVDAVFAGEDMDEVHVEADGVDPEVHGWDPDGRDAAMFPEGVESGDILWVQAGDSIMDSEFWGWHDVNKVTAGDWISDTEIIALTGDIDEVSAYGDGVNAIIYAGGLLTSSDFFMLIDGGTTYSINTYDPDGNPTTPPDLTAVMGVGVGYVENLPTFDDHNSWDFAQSPNVFLIGLQGTTSTTCLNFETLSGEGLWEVEAIDVDVPVDTFMPDGPFDFDRLDVPKVEDGFGEANLRQLRIDAVLGRSDGGGSDHIIRAIGPSRPDDSTIDFDNGTLPNDVGDVQYMYIREFGDRWPDDDFKIEVESLGVFGSSDPDIVNFVYRGELLGEPIVGGQDLQFHIAELVHNETDNAADTDNVASVTSPILITDPVDENGEMPSAYFFTREGSVFGQYGDVMYLLSHEWADAAASVSAVDGTVTYADAPAAYAIGDVNIFAPGASGFESTASVASITETGPAIDFIEVEESIGPVTILADASQPHSTAHLGSVSAGFFIGYPEMRDGSPQIGVDDPIVPASWVSIGAYEPAWDLFPDFPNGMGMDWNDYTGIINPGPDGEFGTPDDFLLSCTSADIESVYVEGDIQDTRIYPFMWWFLPEIGVGKYNIEVAASGSLTGNTAEGYAIQTVDVVQPDTASTGANFESAAVGDDILGDILIDGQINGMIWAGLGKILSLGEDSALSHTFDFGSTGWWWAVLDLNDDIFELRNDADPLWWWNTPWWGAPLAFDPYVDHPDFGWWGQTNLWWFNLRGMQALGSGQIGTYEDPVTIRATEVVAGDFYLSYYPDHTYFADCMVTSIQGPDGVYANIDFQEGMIDYGIYSIRGDVGAPEGNTIDILWMEDSDIWAAGDLFGPVEIGHMDDSDIAVAGDVHGPTTIGEYFPRWWGWWGGMWYSSFWMGGDHLGDLTVGYMDYSYLSVGGELDGDGTFGALFDSDLYVEDGVRGTLTVGGVASDSHVGIGGVDEDSTVGSVNDSNVTLGGVGGDSSVGSVSNDSYVSIGGVGGNSSVGGVSGASTVIVGNSGGNSSVGGISGDSFVSVGSVGGNLSVSSINNSELSAASVAGNSSIGPMNNNALATIQYVVGNSSVGAMSASTHIISSGLGGNGTISSMFDSLWQVGNDDPESLYGDVDGNVTVTYGMDDSAVVIGRDLEGNFNIGSYCTVPAYTSMVGSDLWVGGSIGGIFVEGDIEASDIVAYTGSIGAIRVGDDIIGDYPGANDDVDIFARGNIAAEEDEGIIVQDSIEGRVNIISISGSIGDITVGGDIDKNPDDADGDGIAGWGGSGEWDGVWIMAKFDVGDITVLHGNISGDVVVSAGIGLEATGVENVDENPYVTSPRGFDDIRLELSDWAFEVDDGDPAELAFYIANLGDISVPTGGIFADGDEGIIFSATNMMGDITVGDEIGINGHIVADESDVVFQAGGGFGTVWVAGDMYADDDDIEFVGGEAGMQGMYVGNDIRGDDEVVVELHGALADTTIEVATGCLTYTGALLVGHSIRGEVTVRAASIGDITVGIKGTGNITPDDEEIEFRAMGTGGDIGNITVRDILGGGRFWEEGGEVNIISEDGAVGDIVAGQIATGAWVNVIAEDGIGDIVTLDDAEEGIGDGYDLDLEVNSPFGSIGDIIAHGDIDAADINALIEIDTFDGSIGDIVSMVGSVDLDGLLFGGSIGDIFASEDIYINDVGVEAGNLADDGEDAGTLILDGLCRQRWSSSPVDGIYSELGTVDLDELMIAGNVGPVTAFEGVYITSSHIGGNLGDLSGSGYDDDYGVYLYDLQVEGNIGDITGESLYYGVYLDYVQVRGNVGDITGTALYGEGVYFDEVHIGGNVGDITGTSVEDTGVYFNDYVLIEGNVGDITGTSQYYEGVYMYETIILGTTGDITGTTQDEEGVYLSDCLFGDDVGDITGTTQGYDGVYIYNTNFRGDVGDITGSSQEESGVYMNYVIVEGDVGDITGTTQGESGGYGVYMCEVLVDGSVGDMFGKSEDGEGIYLDEVYFGGVGNVTAISIDCTGFDATNMVVGAGGMGNIFGQSVEEEGIDWDDVSILGSVGNIAAMTAQDDAIDIDTTNVAGNIGNITAIAGDIEIAVEVGGNVGDVVAMTGSLIAGERNVEDGADWWFGWIGIHAHGSIGDVFTSVNIGEPDEGYYWWGDGWWTSEFAWWGGISIVAETGDIGDDEGVMIWRGEYDEFGQPVLVEVHDASYGGVVSATGDILATIHAGHDIYNVNAMMPSFLTPTDQFDFHRGGNILDGTVITAGHDIGVLTPTEARGVIAGGVIEDDVTIIAANNIGVVEAKIIGFGYEEIQVDVIELVDYEVEEVDISFIKIQVPDNDGMLDNNDFLMFNDSNGDDFIDVPWMLARAIAFLDEECGECDVPILADCKISNPEFDRIVEVWGYWWDDLKENFEDWITDMEDLEELTFPDWYNSGNFQVGEVSVEDVDNLIIFTLEGYYEQFDANGDGKPDGIFKDSEDGYYSNGEYDEGEEVTFNYDVPNLPLVFIDHLTTDRITEVIVIDVETNVIEPAALMTIIAQGEDTGDEDINLGRAIGRIEATHDIYANVMVEASRGGIGEVIASHDIGAKGSVEMISLNARTAIDLIYAGHNLGREGVPIEIDVAGAGPGDVITLEMLLGEVPPDTWLSDNGVGVSGGIIAGSGDIDMIIHTGASIGTVQANAGWVEGDYHATGNIGGVYGSLGVDGHFLAELGDIDFVFSAGGDICVTEITAGNDIGLVAAPFGNICGTIQSGGDLGQIVEEPWADPSDTRVILRLTDDDGSCGGEVGTAMVGGETYTMDGEGTALIIMEDGETSITIGGMEYCTEFTATGSAEIDVIGDLLGTIEVAENAVITVSGDFADDDGNPDTITVGQDLCLVVAGDVNQDARGSAGSLSCLDIGGEVNIDPEQAGAAIVQYVLDTNNSTPDIPASYGCVSIEGSASTITAYVTEAFGAVVANVFVMGAGDLVFSSDCSVFNLMAVDDISMVEQCAPCTGIEYVQSCQSQINIKCLDVNGSIVNIVDTYERANIQNVNVTGSIGNIISGKNVYDVEAGGDIGQIAALLGDVTDVTAFGDIERVFAYRDVVKLKAAGNIDEVYATRDIRIVIAGGDLGIVDADRDASEISVAGDIGLVAGEDVRNVFAGGDVYAIDALFNATDIRIDGDLVDDIVAGQDVQRVKVGGNINLINAARDATDIAGETINEVRAARNVVEVAGQDANGDDNYNIFAGSTAVKISPDLEIMLPNDGSDDDV